MKSRCVFPILLLLACAAPIGAQDPAGWLAAVRARQGLPALGEDAVLAAAARGYAGTLLALGGLSHRGPDGSTPMERYRAGGGSALSVGEILGAGGELAAVEEAWLASPAHRQVLLGRSWTRFGAGWAGEGSRRVWVVMFAASPVEGLRLEAEPGGGRTLAGRLRAAAGCLPVLYCGGRAVPLESWDPATGLFRFRLAAADLPRYQRLGFRDPAGEEHISDAFFPALLGGNRPPGA